MFSLLRFSLQQARQTLNLSGQKVVGVFYIILGFAPITSLALSLIGLVPLYMSALWGIVPLLVIGAIAAFFDPDMGRLAGTGLLIGIFAVLLYDCTRIPFIFGEVWGDFIPKIATHLFPGNDPNWVVGYLWRYVGNGGGMGMNFVVGYGLTRPQINRWGLGIGYGLLIWGCLLATLGLMPTNADSLFRVSPLTLTLSFMGHVVYGIGLVLGLKYSPWIIPNIAPPHVERDSFYRTSAQASVPNEAARPHTHVAKNLDVTVGERSVDRS